MLSPKVIDNSYYVKYGVYESFASSPLHAAQMFCAETYTDEVTLTYGPDGNFDFQTSAEADCDLLWRVCIAREYPGMYRIIRSR